MKEEMNTIPQLSDEELIALRQVIADAEHATWLRRQIFLIAPVVFAVVSAVAAAVNWIVNHLSFK